MREPFMEIEMERKLTHTAVAAAVLFASATAAAAEISLFSQENFGGQRVVANDSIHNLANSGFNDRASSAIVRDGSWQLCDDAYFRGRCVTLRAGEYPSLRTIGLDNRVSSARELGGWGPPPAQAGGGWGGGGRAVLYSNSDFRGDNYVIDGNATPNLGNTGFNDRAQSLRVEGGYWIFCSDAGFQGQCRTFGPGSYPTLPRDLDNRISSGRRISKDYPYNSDPNWRQ